MVYVNKLVSEIRDGRWHHLALLKELALDVEHTLVASLQERLVQPFPCAHQPLHLEFLHATIGPYTQISSCRLDVGKHELL